MIKFIEERAKTEDEAISAGLARLGLTRDDVSVEIIERPKHGFLGMGSSPAVVRLSYEAPDEPEPEPKAVETVPEPPKAETKPRAETKPKAETKIKAETKRKAEAEMKAAPAIKAPAPEGSQQERVEKYLRGLLELMGVEADVTITERENGGVNAEISGSAMGAVIGRRGETLDAIQHLVNYSVNRGSEKRMHINVDAENYRSKREDSLVHLAEKMAAKAVKYKRSMALEPMNSYERHVIHTALQNYEGVSTSSVGVEPNRRVVVNYERGGGTNTKPQSREWA